MCSIIRQKLSNVLSSYKSTLLLCFIKNVNLTLGAICWELKSENV